MFNQLRFSVAEKDKLQMSKSDRLLLIAKYRNLSETFVDKRMSFQELQRKKE